MATSGSIDLSTNRDELVKQALQHLGVLNEGKDPNANQLADGARLLNWVVKHIQQAHQGHLFGRQKWYVFLKKNQNSYNLAQGSSDNFCRAANFVNTFVKVAGSATDTTIDVDDITGIANGDAIGIQVENNVVHWTTVNGAPSGDTITLTTGLPSAAAVDNQVYSYSDPSSSGDREMPLLIHSAYRTTRFTASTGAKGTDIPLTEMSQTDYEDLSVKTSSGAPNQFYYDRQRLNGDLWIWPQADDETVYLSMWIQRPLEDFDAAADEPDYPQEWFLALSYQLAMYSICSYGTDTQRANTIFTLADSTLRDALASDTELWVQLRPNERGL